MLLLGGGAVGAGAEATAVAERLGAPVGMTVNAKGVLPDSHPLSLGTTLTLRPVHAAFAEADVVLAVGTEFGETDYFYAPGAAAPDFAGSLVRIDIDADQLHRQRRPPSACRATPPPRWRRSTPGLRGPRARTHGRRRARRCAARGAPLVARRRRAPAVPRGARARHSRRRHPRRRLDAARLRRPPLLAGPLAALLHRSRRLRHARPRTADGDRRAARRARRPVAALAGDGGALFTIPELASAADLGLPIALVIWQNDGYNEMRESMDRIGVPHVGTEISARDFVRLAEGFGCRGVRTGSLDDLPGALAEAFAADRPTLIEVRG